MTAIPATGVCMAFLESRLEIFAQCSPGPVATGLFSLEHSLKGPEQCPCRMPNSASCYLCFMAPADCKQLSEQCAPALQA